MTVIAIATGRYQTFDPHLGLPVRTTVGAPRWRLPYPLAGWWREATPERAWLKLPYEQYLELYLGKLDELGPDRVLAGAQALAEAAGHPGPVVALCFDDLTKPDAWCHRRMLADWITTSTGLEVPELLGAPAENVSI